MLDSLEEMKKLPKEHKKSQTRLSIATGVSQSTISRRYQSTGLKKTKMHMLPHLTDKQRIARIQFALSQLHEPLAHALDRHFKSQLDTVHLNEKLFYVTDESETYYQYPLEGSPKKKGKSKRFIIKCMFLAAIARPRYNHHILRLGGMGKLVCILLLRWCQQ